MNIFGVIFFLSYVAGIVDIDSKLYHIKSFTLEHLKYLASILVLINVE